MAYNSIKTPRIYVDNLSYLQSVGLGNHEGDEDAFGFNLASPHIHSNFPPSDEALYTNRDFMYTEPIDMRYNFIAALGHTFAADIINNHMTTFGFILKKDSEPDSGEIHRVDDLSLATGYDLTGGINTDYALDGYSIWTFEQLSGKHDRFALRYGIESGFGGDVTTGRVLAGSYFDFPHSPDLKLSISYQTGTKEQETKGGVTLSNNMWSVVKWGNNAAWELNDPYAYQTIPKLSHQSRRVWSLTFSYLNKTNTFPKYNALNRLSNESLDEGDLTDGSEYITDGETLFDSGDFYSMVWNKVGTSLPFIFQPDNTQNEYAIAKFDQKGMTFNQQAPNLWQCKLVVKEIW